jgi:hypothetical protein
MGYGFLDTLKTPSIEAARKAMAEMRRGVISSAIAISTASPTTNAPSSASATVSTWRPSPKTDGRICNTAAVRPVS